MSEKQNETDARLGPNDDRIDGFLTKHLRGEYVDMEPNRFRRAAIERDQGDERDDDAE